MTITDLHIVYKRDTMKYPPHNSASRYQFNREPVREYKEYAEWLEKILMGVLNELVEEPEEVINYLRKNGK